LPPSKFRPPSRQQQFTGNPGAPSWKTVGISLAWEEVVHLNEVPPLEEVPPDMVPLGEVVLLNKVPPYEVPLNVVHLDEVPLDMVPLEEVVHLNKVPLDLVPLEDEVYRASPKYKALRRIFLLF
jgi:hypothetical protein